MNCPGKATVLLALSSCLYLAGCGRHPPSPVGYDNALRDAVFRAVDDGKYAEARGLLEAHPSLVNAVDNDGWCLLQRVVGSDDNLASWMLRNGARLDATLPYDNSTALHWAASAGTVEVVKWLLDKGLDPNRRTSDGETPLACATGDIEKVRILVALNPSDRDIDRAILNAVLSQTALSTFSRKLSPSGPEGPVAFVDVSEEEAKAAQQEAWRKADEVIALLRSARKAPKAPFSFWKAARGVAADRMSLKKGEYLTQAVYSTLWKREDGEFLVRIQYPGCELFGTPYDITVIDRTPRVVLHGEMTMQQDDFPYALVEIYSESACHPAALRGKWTLGVACLHWDGQLGLKGALDPNKPRVLVGWNQSGPASVNSISAELIHWENGPSLRYGAGNMSDLDDARFRWAEPGPSIFSEMPKEPPEK